MKKHGKLWLEALEGKELMYDPAETDKYAEEDRISAREEEAKALVKELIEDKIPDGIASCISRGSDRLGVWVPFWLFSSSAFQELRLWAAEQGLILSADCDANPDVDVASGQKFSIGVNPDRGHLPHGQSVPKKKAS